MEKQITVWIGAVLLLAALNCSQAQVLKAYFLVGGNLTLRPTETGNITNILWKFNGNLVAEWVKDEIELDYYDTYKGRTTLDTTTGQLVIKNMKKADVGLYTVEINNKVHGQSYDVKWITKVPKPAAEFRPLTCRPESESCFVTCDGPDPDSLTDAEPIEYSWKIGEKEWKPTETKNITITRAETKEKSIKTVSCRLKNPLNQEDSEPKVNPMYTDPPPTGTPGGTIAGAVIVMIIGIVVVGGLLYKFRSALRTRLFPQRNRGIDIESPSDKEPASAASEAQPLNSLEAKPNNSTEDKPKNATEVQPNNSSEAAPNNSAEDKPNSPPDTAADSNDAHL